MRNKYLLILLSAGMFLSLTGCEKEPAYQDAQTVRFTISSGAPRTKTVYSGEGTGTPGNLSWERIDWVQGDKLLIWSNSAYVKKQAPKEYSAVYAVGKPNVDAGDPNKSWSIIVDEADEGLLYDDEIQDNSYMFWSIYPKSAAVSIPEGGSDDANTVQFVIFGSQGDTEVSTGTTETEKRDTLKPNMDQAIMLAAVKNAKYNSDVEFEYYPAFTAFEFTLSTDDEEDEDLSLSKIVLSSNSKLAGTVTATVKSGTTEGDDPIGASEYALGTDAQTSLTYTFPEGTVISKTHYLTFTVFALPQDIERLKISFYGEDDETPFSEGTLKYNGNDITFGSCLKHCIRGVKIPTGWSFSYLTFDLKVLDWEGVDITGDSSDFPQASQFAVTGEGVKNGYTDLHLGRPASGGAEQKDPYRQQWYFIDDQTVSVFFKVMLPQDGKWELEVVGGTEENPVEADADLFTFTNAYDEEDTTPLKGDIGHNGETAVKINITYNGPEGEAHSFFFHTYAYDTAGNKYNIDSETQIYDRGRGYHTFFVNNSVYNNNT